MNDTDDRRNTAETPGAPGNTHTAALSAFLDHESVDPDSLAAALDDPDARAALVDFVRLRQGLGPASDALAPAALEERHRESYAGRSWA